MSGTVLSCFFRQIKSIECDPDCNLWLHLYYDRVQCVSYAIIYQLLWNDFFEIIRIVDISCYDSVDGRNDI